MNHEVKEWVFRVIRSCKTHKQLEVSANLAKQVIRSNEDKIAYDAELKRNYLRLTINLN